MISPQIKVLPDPKALAAEAAKQFLAAAQSAIQSHGRFSVALSGGSTPKALYELLATPEFDGIDWARVHLFFGDERCVPPDHADSNYRMAHNALLSKVPIPGDNIYRIRGEIDPQLAAKEYGYLLKEQFGDGGVDLTLLGMGPDGHTASLFPGTAALEESKHRCVAVYVEKFKSWRVTMTAPFINRSDQVLVMVAGSDKTQRVAQVLENLPGTDRLPIQLISPLSGKMTWLLDIAAAGMAE
jgi:6-phosphogluconolactonase